MGHYIEENIINSRKELIEVASIIKDRLGISIKIKNFKDWWVN